MNSQAPSRPPLSTADGIKMVRLLGTVSFVCGLLIVITHRGTLSAIGRNQERLTREAVAELLPGMQRQVVYSVHGGELSKGEGSDRLAGKIYAGYDASGKLLGLVMEASERGYADMIKAMYAYSPSKRCITGFKVLEMKETPGLGDKIATDKNFLENFKQLVYDPDHPIVAVKAGAKKNNWEIDAISGATISSRAVGRMLNRSIREMAPLIERNLRRIEKGE
ncbi:MAG: FMN-binding protein [Bryobacteraceae bacterium]|nr:FMN-binding protein [Bryobacteraceae bacterium]MDW8379506.1 FMN-binding protein [Bryobacterales bacterium]